MGERCRGNGKKFIAKRIEEKEDLEKGDENLEKD